MLVKPNIEISPSATGMAARRRGRGRGMLLVELLGVGVAVGWDMKLVESPGN